MHNDVVTVSIVCRSLLAIPVGLLAARGRALRLWLRRPHKPGCYLLHGLLHAALVHDAASTCRDTQRTGGHMLEQTPVYST